jgi:hypothetical protein
MTKNEAECRICKRLLPESDFRKQPQNKTGREYACKKCRQFRKYERRRERRLEKGLAIKFPTLAGRQLAEEGKKYCPGCKQILDIKADFSTMKVRGGIASHCRKCTNAWTNAYSKTAEGQQKRKEHYQQNKEKLQDRKLIRKFGITLEQYRARLDNQKNQCIICGRTPEENGKMLAVDHNHTTKEIRDLLCNNCNVCIGFIEKNKLDTEKLKWYLTKHKINQ